MISILKSFLNRETEQSKELPLELRKKYVCNSKVPFLIIVIVEVEVLNL